MMIEAMVFKGLVLSLAITLLGVAPACRCEETSKSKAPQNSCGHCPEESTPHPAEHSLPDCCCVSARVDRHVEDSIVAPSQTVSVDLDGGPSEPAEPHFNLLIDRPASITIIQRQASPPLHLLLRRLTI